MAAAIVHRSSAPRGIGTRRIRLRRWLRITSAADAVAASSALLDAVAAGEVTPGEAGPVMALLVSHKGIVEACDLERRIAAMEEKGTKR